ncbi:hypothetical protein B0G81_4492 [Paraburkholderia sp. BL6665CI2N2]|uniref:hypothetical protein n=1 Tax=Paraburkholderia sp. BL6665CI2N2 TaxID=1938806 RepID=UPI0010654308|nr:hypothetical protein [Paraburkholderia sp. BL6665CI2N2]TDY24087.1 hypothetical protein B0G81_4492 [Paraburkholderia sp. BL6665CI2N2]
MKFLVSRYFSRSSPLFSLDNRIPLVILSIKISVAIIFIGWLPGVRAAGDLDIPSLSQFSPAYVSTQILLSPCYDVSVESDIEVQRMVREARERYPKGTCTDVRIPPLIFKASFLQYASIAASDDPESLFRAVQTQNAKLASCKNRTCLKTTLQKIIVKLEPVYRNSKPSLENTGGDTCKIKKAIDINTAAGLIRNSRAIIKNIKDQCGASGISVSICANRHENLLFADCNIDMESTQVNSPSWIFRLSSKSTATQLLHVDDGPFDQKRHWCNGLPDLKTEARGDMGSSNIAIYRFDGKRYRTHFSYISENIGDKWRIARYPVFQKIICR